MVLSLKLSGLFPPAALFLDRSLTIFLTNSSVTDFNANLFLMENFCFNNARMRPKFANNYVNFIKMLNCGSSGHLQNCSRNSKEFRDFDKS